MSISVQNLTKEYKVTNRRAGFIGSLKTFIKPDVRIVKAVDNISFDCDDGEIIGFIGRNGAGKSTTIKILTGILYPTSGKVLVNDIEPYKRKKDIAKLIGVVFGQRTQLWWDIPIIDTFNLFRAMYDVDMEEYNKRLNIFFDLFRMGDYINKPVRQLSLGQRICADLCAAMIHNPKILFLDEPTIGLDIINKENIRNFIKEVNRELNTTVILTSHDISDIEELSQRVIIIDNGRIIFNNSIKNMKNRFNTIGEIRVQGNQKDIDLIDNDLKEKKLQVLKEHNELCIRFDSKEYKSTELINSIINKYEVSDISISKNSLEEVIKQIYRNNNNIDI